MTTPAFGLNYDYRCPFARNVHNHVIAAQRAGANFTIAFEPYTLSQGHIEPGNPPAWEDPAHDGDLLSLEASLAVRDLLPEQFLDAHEAFFAARHERFIPLRNREEVGGVLESVGIDPAVIFAHVDGGAPRAEIAETWLRRHDRDEVFGVPTFFVGESAVFIRLMEGPNGDGAHSVATIERLVSLIADHGEINEFKHTKLNR